MKKKKLGEIATIYNGNSINKREKEVKYMKDVPGWNYIGTKDVDFDGTITYRNGVVIPYSETQFRLAPAGSVFVCSEGGSAGRKTAIVKEDVCFGNKLFAIVNDKGLFNEKYLYYYTRYNEFREQFRLLATSLMGGISLKNFNSIELPLPELTEQDRIVERIEELFSEIDSGVDTLHKTQEQLDIYRQAVLKNAFEGKYTEKYRVDNVSSVDADFESIYKQNQRYKDTAGDENEIKLNLPDLWKKIRIGDVFTVDIGATPRRNIAEYWNGDIRWVSSGEVRFCSIYETSEHITQLGVDNSSTCVQPIGTVLLAMIGEGKTRGQAAILGIPAAHNQNTAAILVSETPCSSKFLYYFLMLNYENTRRVGSGNNQKALNKDRVRALHIPFTSFEEQRLVVDEIEVRFSTCDNIENTIQDALNEADAMRQSILKSAFEGRL